MGTPWCLCRVSGLASPVSIEVRLSISMLLGLGEVRQDPRATHARGRDLVLQDTADWTPAGQVPRKPDVPQSRGTFTVDQSLVTPRNPKPLNARPASPV